MNGDITSKIERLSLEGPIGSETAIGIGIVLAVVFAGLLWSQRRATGILWAALFLGLRVVALGLLLWMLLGPAWVTQRRTSKPQSVAILIDVSPSMTVSDPPSLRQQRWDQAGSGDQRQCDPLAECDRAAVSLRVAARRSRVAQSAVERHQATRVLRQQVDSIAEALARGVTHLEAALAGCPADATDAAGKTQRILSRVQGQIAPHIRSVAESLVENADVLPADLAESLSSIEDELAGLDRRLAELIATTERRTAEETTSAATRGRGGDSRLEQVAQTLEALQTLAEDSSDGSFTIKAYTFDEQVRAITDISNCRNSLLETERTSSPGEMETPIAAASRTDLAAALEHLGRTAGAESIQSAILISDGAHNVVDALGPQDAAATLAGLPVHVVPIGNTTEPRDVMLLRVNAPTTVVEDDSILIDVIVTAVACSGETTALTLRKNGKAIDQQTMTFEGERTDVRAAFQVQADELGRHEFELSLDLLEDEADEANNVASLPINVVKDTLRVLLVDSIARWEYRYLDQLFRRDPSVTFERLLFEPEVRATGALAETGMLPQDVAGWSNYDVVILGDVRSEHLDESSQQALDEFVRLRGGNLVVVAGEEHMPVQFVEMPLMALLPVESGRKLSPNTEWKLVPTPAGENHPALTIADTWTDSERLWKEQYASQPFDSLSEFSRPKPTAESLLAVVPASQSLAEDGDAGHSPAHALLCWHQVGAGRVVYLAAPVTYRLRFRHGDRYHHRFWGQLLRWLTAAERAVGTQTVRIATDRIHYNEGEAISVTLRLSDADGVPVVGAEVGAQATSDGGVASTVDLIADEKVPGRYRGAVTNLKAGAYRVAPTGSAVERLLPDTADLELTESRIHIMEAGNPELVDTRCQIAILRQIAELTGGQVVPPTALNEILTLSAVTPEFSEQVEREPLWNRWSLLLIAFSCLCVEWIVRKQLGLV